MDSVSLLAGVGVGVLLGAVIGFLYARNRLAGVTADLTARARAADERARAAHDQAALVDGYLAERFQALSAQALDASQRRLLEVSEIRMRAANLAAAGELDSRRNAVEQLVEPLRQTLARVEAQLVQTEAARQSSHAALTEQVKFATAASEQLRAQTQALVTALRRPEARGRWGEMQLRRVVELAGMSARCDFDEQVTVAGAGHGEQGEHGTGAVRPDMVVRLAGGKNIVVDSKVALAAYLEAAETADEDVREARLAAHGRHLKEHVDRLAAKAYWSALSPSPEFVVLFIPGEAFLAPALEREPALLEYGKRPRRFRSRARTLRPADRPRRARRGRRQVAGRRRRRLQQGGRHAGGPGPGHRAQAKPARCHRRGPRGAPSRRRRSARTVRARAHDRGGAPAHRCRQADSRRRRCRSGEG